MQSAIAPEHVLFEKPTVVPTETNMIIRVNPSNTEWGHIVLKQAFTDFDENGFIEEKYVTCLIKGPVDKLVRLNWKPWQQLKGKIVIHESVNPFSELSHEYDLKLAGRESGIILRVDDKPIYRRTFYSINPDSKDIFVKHTNKDEIRTAIQMRANSNRKMFADASLDE